MKKRNLFICGTRPDIIKFAPLIQKMKPIVLHTGQHNELAEEAFKIFNIKPDYDLKLMKDNQNLPDFISRSIKEIQNAVDEIKPDRIWVLGDTSSSYAGALVSYLNKIPLVHLEAGLRTFDNKNPFPEELFRKTIDQMSDLLFAPTRMNVKNLEREQVSGKVYEVGNLIVESLNIMKNNVSIERPVKEPYILMTMHRRESFGKEMGNVFSLVKELSKKIKVIFPIHPNPNVRKIAKEIGLTTIEPLNYLDFLWYLKHCEFIMSDSGGIQEEVPSFNKPILILRKVTERQEILKTGLAFLTDLTKKDLFEKIKLISNLKGKKYDRNPFGDGQTSDKIIQILKEL